MAPQPSQVIQCHPCRRTIVILFNSYQGWGNKGVHAFSKGMSLKVNIIAWLEFELTYFEAAV